MFDHPPREKEIISWAYAVLWAGLTFVTVPYVRVGVVYISDNVGAGLFTYTVVLVVCAAAAFALYSIRRRATFWSCFWLVGIAGLIVYLAFGLAGGSPVEAIHYVQYGTLSVFLFRAFSHRVRDYSIYLAVTLICTLAGMIDETIQWLAPDRVFDLRDIWLNFKAAALVQIGLAAGIRPKSISGAPGWLGLRRICLLSALVLAYFGLCLQNTPQRVASYVSAMPSLGFVKPTQNIMVEYGYLLDDADKFSFRSRLTQEQLSMFASKRSEDGKPNLDDVHERDMQGDYNFRELLLSDTFLYEGRLHQLRRDQNLERAKSSWQQDKKAQHFAEAFWENAILKEHFFEILEGTRYQWSQPFEADVMAQADLTIPYSSSISTHLLVAFNTRQAALLTIGGVVLFLLGALLCNREMKRNGNV